MTSDFWGEESTQNGNKMQIDFLSMKNKKTMKRKWILLKIRSLIEKYDIKLEKEG